MDLEQSENLINALDDITKELRALRRLLACMAMVREGNPFSEGVRHDAWATILEGRQR